MSLYHILLFFHISGTILLFIAWSMEYVQINNMKSHLGTQTDVANPCAIQKKKNRHSMIAMMITLGSGVWLMLLSGSHAAWMLMAMIALLLIMVTGMLLFRMAAKSGSNHSKHYRLLASSIRIRLATGAGIVALMVFKPLVLWGALFVIISSLIAGGIWLWITGHRHKA